MINNMIKWIFTIIDKCGNTWYLSKNKITKDLILATSHPLIFNTAEEQTNFYIMNIKEIFKLMDSYSYLDLQLSTEYINEKELEKIKNNFVYLYAIKEE